MPFWLVSQSNCAKQTGILDFACWCYYFLFCLRLPQEARLQAACSLVEDLRSAQEEHESSGSTVRTQPEEVSTTALKAEAALGNCSDLAVSASDALRAEMSSHWFHRMSEGFNVSPIPCTQATKSTQRNKLQSLCFSCSVRLNATFVSIALSMHQDQCLQIRTAVAVVFIEAIGAGVGQQQTSC